MLIEVIVNIPMQIPDNTVTFEFEMLGEVATYSLDDIITSVTFIKLYIVLRVSSVFSEWMSP
jgi:hypothetical protein